MRKITYGAGEGRGATEHNKEKEVREEEIKQ